MTTRSISSHAHGLAEGPARGPAGGPAGALLWLLVMPWLTGCALCQDWVFEDRFSLVCADPEPGAPAGVPGCWTSDHQPLLTVADVDGPLTEAQGLAGEGLDTLRVQGCARIGPASGRCVAGPLTDAPADHHLPAGVWITQAEGLGCPGVGEAECSAEVGRAEAVLMPAVGALGRVEGPAGASWVQTPIWHLDAMGLVDMVGVALESWDGQIPWGQEGGDVLMNLTGVIYDQLSGSE